MPPGTGGREAPPLLEPTAPYPCAIAKPDRRCSIHARLGRKKGPDRQLSVTRRDLACRVLTYWKVIPIVGSCPGPVMGSTGDMRLCSAQGPAQIVQVGRQAGSEDEMLAGQGMVEA